MQEVERPNAWPDIWHNSLQEGSSLQSTFDKVHGLPNGASNTQADIFSDIQDVVLSPLEGLSAFVIAFGQAGRSSGSVKPGRPSLLSLARH